MKAVLILMNIILIVTLTNEDVNAQDRKSKKKQNKEYLERVQKDSIDGVYIPIDLNDCFKQLDGFWIDSIKTEVRNMTEDEFTSNAHFGIGLWMRNNWGLWGGSRLSKYFNTLGIFHPDDMSGTILTSYHRHLLGQDIKLEEQIEFYKNYWEKDK